MAFIKCHIVHSVYIVPHWFLLPSQPIWCSMCSQCFDFTPIGQSILIYKSHSTPFHTMKWFVQLHTVMLFVWIRKLCFSEYGIRLHINLKFLGKSKYFMQMQQWHMVCYFGNYETHRCSVPRLSIVSQIKYYLIFYLILKQLTKIIFKF